MDVKKSLLSLLESGRYSDLEVKCGSRVFKVHKAIVCSNSEWFESACSAKRKEGNEEMIELCATNDQQTKTDFIPDDPDAVKYMLEFLYVGDYRVVPENAKSTAGAIKGTSASPDLSARGPIYLHNAIFALGVRYLIPGLQTTAIEKLKKALSGLWYPTDFAKALKVACQSTLREFRQARDVMVEEILKNPATNSYSAVADAIQGIDGLAYELFSRQNLRLSWNDPVPKMR